MDSVPVRLSGTVAACLASILALSAALAAPASVILTEFSATPQDDGSILVRWVTATELDAVAFRLYRALAESGPWDTWVFQTPVKGDGVSGATYEYNDRDVSAGTTYYYLLESLQTDGSIIRYYGAIVHATARSSTMSQHLHLPMIVKNTLQWDKHAWRGYE